MRSRHRAGAPRPPPLEGTRAWRGSRLRPRAGPLAAGPGRSSPTSSSTATSTSTSTTGGRRWISSGSSSGARGSRSGRRSQGSSPCSGCGAEQSPRCWRLARRVPSREGLLARATSRRTRSGDCSCRPGRPISCCSHRYPLLVPTLARRLGERVRPVSSARASLHAGLRSSPLLTVVVPGVPPSPCRRHSSCGRTRSSSRTSRGATS